MQTINFDIGQLLKKISSGHFLIPQFQRDFTWKEGQTRLLVDSIARNYPVGSLLILGKNEDVPLKSRKLDANYPPKDDINNLVVLDDSSSESYYVLDGQQRLTSIARVFLDAHPKRNYYFDLKKMHEVFSNESPSWIVSRARGKKNPERKDNNRLIRTDIALDQAKCDVYISEYIEDSGDFPEFQEDRTLARKAAASLKGVFETIRKFSIPFVALDNDAPLESVCRVFETINSTGTRLTTFDLAVARYYPEPDLKELFDNSKECYPILNEYDVDGERILQILSLYYLRNDVNKFPEATRSVLLSLKPDFIAEHWHNAAFHLSETCKWVKALGATAKTQPPHGTLVSIAATLMCFPDSLSKPAFSSTLRKWYFCSTLAANPSPANNYKVGDDFRRFCDFLDNGETIQYPRVYFTNEEIIDIKHISDSRYKAIQALMRTTVKEDLMTGNSLDGDLEDHHIYPYSLNKSGLNKNKLNSIANKIIVSRESNRDIGDSNPDKYFMEIIRHHQCEGNSADLDRRLASCLIPYSSTDPNFERYVSKESFDQFLEDRGQMIANRIQEIVGDAWKAPLDDDEANLEDDEFVTS
ncbi:hypothetical protein BFW38_11760 [Terasakiispira papahanaumokuakeensis]|uniref:GmrSD restriction endonucleases N-terminal domain-containing protein n=1 Tax=Terasakiispira papahanaumokuakeensis TaxID=197479 RepID=A0A1E2VB71_9GAMM|nr:DUF262 domain-containing protein [Terasakiispira papahanaumokuakeensis]ODC04102.1 hypothetical protein BFW38_11760 [Terasakiispira papahanaumokuakeensis]